MAWHVWTLLEYVFGLRMSATGGVTCKPCLPKAWKNAKLTRRFAGKTYTLTVTDGNVTLSEE